MVDASKYRAAALYSVVCYNHRMITLLTDNSNQTGLL